MNVRVDFRPVKLRDLVERPEGPPSGSARPKLGPRKSADYQNSVRHWAKLCGATIAPTARDLARSDTTLALQAALVARDEGRFAEYHHSAYRARWAEPRDLSEREVVRELLANAGLDGDAALARAESPELAGRLEAEGLGRASSACRRSSPDPEHLATDLRPRAWSPGLANV